MTIAAIVPTWRRPADLQGTLERILACDPPPDEVLVHVDAGDPDTPLMLSNFPSVRILTSSETAGPGGGRNKLTAAAESDWIASFDDDSWPLDNDFFARAPELAERLQADLLACRIHERQVSSELTVGSPRIVSSFVGCGCVYRREAFLSTGGYVPLRYAYGMEENDVALKLIDRGGRLMQVDELQVFHNCDRENHHASPRINGSQVANTILLGFLRYPICLWPLAWFQCANRILYSLRKGRWRGLAWGLCQVPLLCWRYRRYRRPVTARTVMKARSLRERSR